MIPKFSPMRTLAAMAAAGLLAPLVQAQQAPDVFVLRSGDRRPVTVTRADKQNLYYQTASGEAPMPRASIRGQEKGWVADGNWFVAERQGVRESLAAVDAGQSAKAIPALKAVVDRYLVLPVKWSTDASVALVRAYTEQKQFAEADAVAKQFMDAHPALVNLVKPYLALALAGQGKYDDAIGLLTEAVKATGDKLVVSPTEGRMLGAAHLALGDCYQAKGEAEKALESYLTTVVLYYHDDGVVRQAHAKADELKKRIRPQAAKNVVQ